MLFWLNAHVSENIFLLVLIKSDLCAKYVWGETMAMISYILDIFALGTFIMAPIINSQSISSIRNCLFCNRTVQNENEESIDVIDKI